MKDRSNPNYGAETLRHARRFLVSARLWWRSGCRRHRNVKVGRQAIRDWARGWGKAEDNLCLVWREALVQLRQLHGDVWNGTKFFLTLNGILMAGLVAFLRESDHSLESVAIPAILCSIGLVFVGFGIYVFLRHRQYYLDMMIRKTLIEEAMGLYDCGIDSIDLTFPWNVEKRFLEQLHRDPQTWARHRVILGKISPIISSCYAVFGMVYVGVLLYLINYHFSRLELIPIG